MKAIARVSIAVPDEFLKTLSQNDLKELILNKSRLDLEQRRRLCDMIEEDAIVEIALLVDLNQLVAENIVAENIVAENIVAANLVGGPGGFGVATSKIRPAGAQETILQRLKRYLVEG